MEKILIEIIKLPFKIVFGGVFVFAVGGFASMVLSIIMFGKFFNWVME